VFRDVVGVSRPSELKLKDVKSYWWIVQLTNVILEWWVETKGLRRDW